MKKKNAEFQMTNLNLQGKWESEFRDNKAIPNEIKHSRWYVHLETNEKEKQPRLWRIERATRNSYWIFHLVWIKQKISIRTWIKNIITTIFTIRGRYFMNKTRYRRCSVSYVLICKLHMHRSTYIFSRMYTRWKFNIRESPRLVFRPMKSYIPPLNPY